MTKTEDNLKNAFAGESQANRKYLAFSKKAEEDGFLNIAKMFRAIAEAETVHALNHFRVMRMIKTTKENLQTALDGETYEFTEMYPNFIKVANKEGIKDASMSFGYADEVEKVHGKLYRRAIESINKNKDIEEREYFVCPVCGNTFEGDAPDRCPICSTPREKFKKIL
jgi:rubrerythrin